MPFAFYNIWGYTWRDSHRPVTWRFMQAHHSFAFELRMRENVDQTAIARQPILPIQTDVNALAITIFSPLLTLILITIISIRYD